jgi:RNA polymerase sigma-70 factor (ECF subfamily)
MLFTSEPRSNEAALVAAAQAGDRAAFGSLYRQFSRMIHGVLLAHVSYTEAEDLMQDVFVRALQQVAGLKEAGAFGGWLCAIARRAAFDHRRRSRPLDALPDSLTGGPRPDGEAFEVLGLIQQLPESYRETLVLRLVEGMTGPEIAARTGLTEASVRVNLCRGMKLLRERLERRT